MLKIIKDDQPLLKKVSEEVSFPLIKEDEELLLSMLDYLKKSQDDAYAEKHQLRSGVGLAAPQVGVLKRMFAVYYEKEDAIVQYALINPKIIVNSTKLCAIKNGEGCLSIDEDREGYVYRYFKVIIKAYDLLQKKEVHITARGYDAIVLQHELDHLNGILYYDRIDKNQPHIEKENAEMI